jgi:DNA-binding transcriptional LysR family regulator
MELRHIRYFIAVAEHEHFGRAAAAINVSQPALSQQVAELERELGVQLFDRRPRGVQLSDAGREFLTVARDVLSQLDEGIARTRDVADGRVGRLVIGLPEASRGSAIARAATQAFQRDFPQVTLVTSALAWTEQPSAVLAGRLDVGFAWSLETVLDDGRAAPRHPAGLDAARVFADRPRHALVAAEHPLANAPTVSVTALAPYDFVLFPRSLHPPLHDAIVRAVVSAGGRRPALEEGVVAANGLGPILAATNGWALVPDSQAAAAPPGTVARPLLGIDQQGGLDVVWRDDDRRTMTTAFVAAVLEAANVLA